MGKARIIQQLLGKDPTLIPELLAVLPVNDLSRLLLSKEPEAAGVVSSGEVSDKKYIGLEKAKEIALEKTPDGQITKAEYDTEDGRMVYEVDVLLDGVEHEFDIDALTGDILKWDNEAKDDDDHPSTSTTSSSTMIGRERAKKIAQGRLSGGKITELELEKDDGRWVYEGEIETAAVEVDFEIDAYTGDIHKWEEDPRD